MNCTQCINSRIITDQNGYEICSECGICVAADRADEGQSSGSMGKQYSVYDEGFSYSDVCHVNNGYCLVSDRYTQKSKEFKDTVNNFTRTPAKLFPLDISNYLLAMLKNEKYKELYETAKKNPSKKIIYKIFKNVELSNELKNKYKSRIDGTPLIILKRKNVKTRWFQFKLNFINHENLNEFSCFKELLHEDIFDLLCNCFNTFITQYFSIIGRKIRIASPNSIVTILCYLYAMNPLLLLKYKHLFDIPLSKTIMNNIEFIIMPIWRYKFHHFKNLRNYICSIINELYRGSDFLKDNILNIDYEQIQLDVNKCIINRSLTKSNTTDAKIIEIIISLYQKTW